MYPSPRPSTVAHEDVSRGTFSLIPLLRGFSLEGIFVCPLSWILVFRFPLRDLRGILPSRHVSFQRVFPLVSFGGFPLLHLLCT